MDFTNFQMTLTAALILTGAAIAVFYDHRRKQRQEQLLRVQVSSESLRRTQKVSQQAVVATATHTRPPSKFHPDREKVTVKITNPITASPWHSNLPEFTIDAALWERLIATQPKQPLLNPAPVTSVAHATQQPSALEDLLENREAFTGLVVSIGVNDADSSLWHNQRLMQSISSFIGTLLNEKDYYCRIAFDEFVMVCPGDPGSVSQRRLNHISERLWDYQLRGVGASSILFSWGGVQVQNEPLAEAVAAATDRMRQTKRIAPAKNSPLTQAQPV